MFNSKPAVLAFDIGGSKVHGAVVSVEGRVLRELRREARLNAGPDGFLAQLESMVGDLLRGQDIGNVGIGSAGPLDARSGELLDPTNFFTSGKSWGRVDLLTPLRRRFPQLRFSLDNDAAAAVLGEAFWGGGETRDLVVMTLGTGVGVGALVSGHLVRSRDGLHPEASHIPLDFHDASRACGCGNLGCIEAYLAGSHTVAWLRREWQEPGLTGQELVARAQRQDRRALTAFAQYGEWLAQAIHAFAVLYGPKQVSLGGGFAAAAPYFLPTTLKRLPEILARRRVGVDLLPTVKVSALGDKLGILGAARLAMT